jgi:hypothetical protein
MCAASTAARAVEWPEPEQAANNAVAAMSVRVTAVRTAMGGIVPERIVRSFHDDPGLWHRAAPVANGRPIPSVPALPSQLMSLAFDIDGRVHEFSEPLAELLAENLHNFSLGPSHRYYCDVEMLARAGIDPSWTEGARAMANIIEDTLVGCHEGPIPLDPRGKSATGSRLIPRVNSFGGSSA